MYEETLLSTTVVLLASGPDLLWGPSLLYPATGFVLQWCLFLFLANFFTLFPSPRAFGAVAGTGIIHVPVIAQLTYQFFLSVGVATTSLFVSANATIWTPNHHGLVAFLTACVTRNKPPYPAQIAHPYRMGLLVERVAPTVMLLLTAVLLQVVPVPYNAFAALFVANGWLFLGAIYLCVPRMQLLGRPTAYTVLGLLTAVVAISQIVGYLISLLLQTQSTSWLVSESLFALYVYLLHAVFLIGCPFVWQLKDGLPVGKLFSSMVWTGWDPIYPHDK